jgi:hypothetical protein
VRVGNEPQAPGQSLGSGAVCFWGLAVSWQPPLRRPKTAAGAVPRKSPTMLWITQNTELSVFGDKHAALKNLPPIAAPQGLYVVYDAALRISWRAERCQSTSFGSLHEPPWGGRFPM